ncbi:MAG: 3-deoxy-D-manno-octulosonic acid transferase [Rhodobacterales bacterium]|nr:3-deoxy-D-manno-octulosonic acid transferase [Rhodobacterales bacterium]
MTLLLNVYMALTAALPIIPNTIARRIHAHQKADPARLPERLGQPTLPRPPGRLIWLHAASVGEFLAVKDLAADLIAELPHAHLLVTTTTAASATLVPDRAPQGTLHQFLPADTLAATKAFLDHWQPDLAIFTESDLWPRMLARLADRAIPATLINVRASRTRERAPRTTAALLSHFSTITTQTESIRTELTRLGLSHVTATGDLKADATPLPFDPGQLAALKAHIRDRPVWIAASTHPDDEAPVLAAHSVAREKHPDLLLILIPRHSARASPIRAFAKLDTASRSKGEEPGAATDIYIADTLGETGLFYRLAPLAFLGGSFGPEGGHNPYEPARLGLALLHGPHVAHFAAPFRELGDAGAAREVRDGTDLGHQVAALIGTTALTEMQEKATAFMATQTGARARTLALLLALLPPND